MRLTQLPLTSMKCIIAVLAIAVLPSVAVASLFAATPVVAQAGLVVDGVTQLGDKNMNYWFLALAGITIVSWTYTAKWLLEQLESQRAANSELVNKLVNYMEKDHAETRVALNSSINLHERVIEKFELHLNQT